MIRKISPNNLAGISRHFDRQRSDIKKKLRCLNKKKLELENELAVCEDGIKWCEDTYKLSKVGE